jgi:hypothetical protein
MSSGRHGNVGSSPRSPTGPSALPRRWFTHHASYRAPGIGSIWPDFGLIVKCRRQLSRRFGRGTKSDPVVLLLTQSPLVPKRWPACRDLVAPRREGGVSAVHPPGRLVAATWSLVMVSGSQTTRTKRDQARRSPGCAFELSTKFCPRRRIKSRAHQALRGGKCITQRAINTVRWLGSLGPAGLASSRQAQDDRETGFVNQVRARNGAQIDVCCPWSTIRAPRVAVWGGGSLTCLQCD